MKGAAMSKYLVDKAFEMLHHAEFDNDNKLWREAVYSAIEALVDVDPYARSLWNQEETYE
jgi:hypothetical protein